ncbi:MAG: NAD-dependent epimerase/dehydratase family protein, partial [Clostridia bacterium]|nr:NAD-dependent epimerase/dehydratase family protein [Clostridia bacterium]
MKILVTGGTVFVSKYIAEYFSAKGHDVYVLNRNTKPQLKKVKLIQCDRGEINGRLKGHRFDTVIDVTAYTAKDINLILDELDGFENYVMISSSAVYPETLAKPFKEYDTCARNKFWGDYGTNKIAAEAALTDRVPGAYIIRPPYLYGEYNNIYREAFVFDCAEKDAPFYLPKDGSLPLQFFHVEDLCRFIEILLKTKPEQRIYNVGNKSISVK